MSQKKITISAEYTETKQKKQFEPVRIGITLTQDVLITTGSDLDREIKKIFNKAKGQVKNLISVELASDD